MSSTKGRCFIVGTYLSSSTGVKAFPGFGAIESRRLSVEVFYWLKTDLYVLTDRHGRTLRGRAPFLQIDIPAFRFIQ